MAAKEVFQCNECHQGVIDNPANFLVLHRTLICQSCFETLSTKRVSESLLLYTETLPYTAISSPAIKAAKRLKELRTVEIDQEIQAEMELCRKEIEDWIEAAIRKNEGLPKVIEDLMKGIRKVPLIGELTASDIDIWVCPRCALQNRKNVIECACGYRELKLYGLSVDSSIYWKCVTCGFYLNVLSNGTCSSCARENAALIEALEAKQKKGRCAIV